MDRIKQVYKTLSRSEVKNLKGLLAMIHTKGENKPLEFLGLIEKDPEITAETASQHLYGDPKSKAFIMMKSRLYERMLDFICFMGEAEAGPDEAIYNENQFKYRKAAIHAAALRARKLRPLALPILEEAITYAQKCCAPEWELDLLNQKRNFYRMSAEEFDEISRQLIHKLRQVEVNLNTGGIYAKFHLLLPQTEGVEKGFEFISRHMADLEQALKETPSPRGAYYFGMLRYHQSAQQPDLENTRSILAEVVQLLEQNPGLLHDTRANEPTFQLAVAEYRLGNYDASIAIFRNIFERYEVGHVNRCRIGTMMIHVYMAMDNLGPAAELIEEMDRFGDQGQVYQDVRFLNIYLYGKSLYEYKRGKLVEAWQVIQDTIDAFRGIDLQLVNLKLFEIMILVERGITDVASQKLENLRKHMAKYPHNNRQKTIHKILNGQEKRDFDFQSFKKEAELFQQLRDEEEWDISRYEIMPFEAWYVHMCRKNKRNANIEVPQIGPRN